ncbi:hypothetical protein HY68_11230 [Streptomyces sp. AcH 505]|nr:hypothetical protein HY68_11230 [Streptomyces sp. AcH 505]
MPGRLVGDQRPEVQLLLVLAPCPGPRRRTALAAREHQQPLDELFAAPVVVEQGLFRTGEIGGRAAVVQADLDRGALGRQRGPQFVRGVGDEAALAVESRLEPAEQRVERVAQLLEFVVGPARADPLVEVALRQPARRRSARTRETSSGNSKGLPR